MEIENLMVTIQELQRETLTCLRTIKEQRVGPGAVGSDCRRQLRQLESKLDSMVEILINQLSCLQSGACKLEGVIARSDDGGSACES
jgi:hypothetical protein